MKRIVFATFGSLGDLHPYIALSLQLKRRGHRPLIVTSDVHREVVESAGVEFATMRPNAEHMGDTAELARRLFHPTKGPEHLVRELVMPHVRGAYEDLDRACAGADLIVTHPLAFVGRLVAEKRGLPWRSSVLSPLSLMSSIDPPLFGPAPWLLWIRRLGVAPYRAVFKVAKWSIGAWEKPLHELRAELGLPPMRSYAQFEGQYAPDGNLALFSRVLAKAQADWPQNTTMCGFLRYDGEAVDPVLERELKTWLSAGAPPVVYTLGSSVSLYATDFFKMAVEATQHLGQRALLLTGRDPAEFDAILASAQLRASAIKVFRYLPYSAVFPHASVNVHQAGVGTLAQALAAGKPQLIVPVGFDQPDNALRAVRLGLAHSIPFQKLTVSTMTAALRELSSSARYGANAVAVAQTVVAEEQEHRAADLLGNPMRRPRPFT
ncbi:MAG: rhamnosyltransferase subunit [Betaproteobacteria bacterium]